MSSPSRPAVPLSILDLVPRGTGTSAPQAVQHALELARLADGLGFHRLWYAEHHNMPAVLSTTPELMIAAAARETSRLRLGSGGVMLPNHAPLRVAESFRLLAAMFPGRIDLGIGRAPGTDGRTALALRRSGRLGADDFPEQLAELRELTAEGAPRSIGAVPDDVPLPPVWILGSSGFGAQLAAELGLGFAFAHHINPVGAVAALRGYRGGYRPRAGGGGAPAVLPRAGGCARPPGPGAGGGVRGANGGGSRPGADGEAPRAILTVAVVCADTQAQAGGLALTLDLVYLRLHSGARLGLLPSPDEVRAHPWTAEERRIARAFRAQQIVGDPAQVRARLVALLAETGADELMVNSTIHDHAARMHCFELLAGLALR